MAKARCSSPFVHRAAISDKKGQWGTCERYLQASGRRGDPRSSQARKEMLTAIRHRRHGLARVCLDLQGRVVHCWDSVEVNHGGDIKAG